MFNFGSRKKITFYLVQYQIFKSSSLENCPKFCPWTLIWVSNQPPLLIIIFLGSGEKVTGNTLSSLVFSWSNLFLVIYACMCMYYIYICRSIHVHVLQRSYYHIWVKGSDLLIWKPGNQPSEVHVSIYPN